MVTKIDAPEIDFQTQPIVIYSENREMGYMQRDMLRAFKKAEIRCAMKLSDLRELSNLYSVGAVIVNAGGEARVGEIMSSIRDTALAKNPFALSLLVTGTVSEKIVKGSIMMGFDGLLCLPLSGSRLWKTVEGLSKKSRTFVQVQNYFGPERREIKAAPKSQLAPERRETDVKRAAC